MSPPARMLRVCRANAERFSLPLPAWEALGDVECVACLAQCGDCEAGPFIELDGTLVFTDSLAELAAKLAAPAPRPS